MIFASVLVILLAYVAGSMPTAYIFAKLLKGIDIREYGSGNVGATNVIRVVGKGPGIAVFVIDFLKGTFAVTLLPFLVSKLLVGGKVFESNVLILSGSAAIAGHIWTVFLKFKGGKGVATTGGVMAGLSPVIMLTGLVVWIIVFFIWRYVSLASISAAVTLPVSAVIWGKGLDFVIFSSALCIVGVYSHRSNIKRLLERNENKLK